MKLNFVIILLIYFVMIIFAEQTDYCSIHSSHFLCSNRAPNRDPVVVKHYPDKDKEEITTIVELFNNFRSFRANGTKVRADRIQNHGGNMLEMQWDEELATIAKMIASRRADDVTHFSFCCSCNILDRFESHALIRDYDGKSEEFVWKETLVDQLFISMEIGIGPFQHDSIHKLDKKFWLEDSFYLLVRAETYLVGCDLAIYKQNEQIRHRLVCIFGPITSWLGEKVYDFGRPCSKCPTSTECSSDNPSLCKCQDVCIPKRTKTLSNSEAVTTNYPENKLNETKENMHYCSTNQRHFLCNLTNSYEIGCEYKKILPETESYRMKILQVFNQYRNKVAGGDVILGGVELPSASNMLKLDWDGELELAAKNIVDSCRLKYFEFCCNCHQFDRFTANFFQVEIQNNTELDSEEPDWNIILGLLLEKYSTHDMRSFNVNNITDEFYSEKRFELIANARVQRLGCAITKFFKDPWSSKEIPTYMAVCVFAGLSGWKGTPIYTSGKPCSNCGPKAMCSRDSHCKNLCVCQAKQYCFSPPNNYTFVWFNGSQSSVKEEDYVPEKEIKEMEKKYHVTCQPYTETTSQITSEPTSQITSEPTSQMITDTPKLIEVQPFPDDDDITFEEDEIPTEKSLKFKIDRDAKSSGVSTEFLYNNVLICFAYFIYMFIRIIYQHVTLNKFLIVFRRREREFFLHYLKF